jgi:hypothetical protein
MKRVTVIGGNFFKAKNAGLRTWIVPAETVLRAPAPKPGGGTR